MRFSLAEAPARGTGNQCPEHRFVAMSTTSTNGQLSESDRQLARHPRGHCTRFECLALRQHTALQHVPVAVPDGKATDSDCLALHGAETDAVAVRRHARFRLLAKGDELARVALVGKLAAVQSVRRRLAGVQRNVERRAASESQVNQLGAQVVG